MIELPSIGRETAMLAKRASPGRRRMKLQSHSGFLQQVIELAQLHCWKVAGFRKAILRDRWITPVLGDAKGFPDLLLVREERLIFAELKVGKDKLSPEQKQWQDVLTFVAETVIWGPEDWEEIVWTLK